MTKKLNKVILGLAITGIVGTGTIGVNSLLTSFALAADANTEVPVITADVPVSNESEEVTPLKSNTEQSTVPGAVIKLDDNGNQTIVFDESLTEEERLQLERDLERALIDQNGGADSSEAAPVFIAGTPSENDLPEEAAIKTAREAIINDYALTDETLSKFSIHTSFNVVDPEVPVWSITFYPTNQNDYSQIGNYNITIDSTSGEIIEILSAADGVG